MYYVEVPCGILTRMMLEKYEINTVEKLIEYRNKNGLIKRTSAEVYQLLQQNKIQYTNEASLVYC